MKIYKLTALTILILLVGCNSKVEKNKYEEFTSDRIIKNYFKAIGGYEKIKKIETLIKRGHYVEPAYNIVPVNGVLFPFSHIERNEKTGKFLNATIWSELVANIDIPNDVFDPPIDANDTTKSPPNKK